MLEEMDSLESISFGSECWERGKEELTQVYDDADEWKDPKWWT